MNIFIRSVFWALPFWAMLFSLRFIYIPYDFWTEIVQTIIRPGVVVCLWFADDLHNLEWFTVITTNLVIYYLAIVLVLFIAGKYHRNPRT